MAEWHVSGSDSEGGEGVDDIRIEVGKLSIPASRVADLLQTLDKRKTLDLECLAGNSPPARERRRKHKKRSRKRNDSSTASGNSKSQEDVSETASELRSTTSTDTREGKW